jgi:hypothetical protein
MATIVNNPPPSPENSNNGLGTLVALLSILLLGALFYIYGLPALRTATQGPQINVPDQIDVNVNTPQGDNAAPPPPSQ